MGVPVPVPGGMDIGLPDTLHESPEMLAALGADVLGVSSGSVGDAPFVLEIDEGLHFELNNLGAVRLRLRSRTLPPQCPVAITLKAGAEFGLKGLEPLVVEPVSAGEPRLLPLRQCRPSAAGSVPLEVFVDVFNASSEMLGRWQGSHVVKVARPETAKQINIQGDVLDMGSGGLAAMLGLGGRSGKESWRTIPCYPDGAYQARIRRALPSWKLEAPALELSGEEGKPWTGPWLVLGGLGQLGHQRATVFWGAQVLVGRWPKENEPDAGTHFRVDADNGGPNERGCISGTHCQLRLHEGKAWVQDLSSNGTWLDNELLPKHRWHLLVPGDLLSLSRSKVATLKVHLQADAHGVTAVCLSQQTFRGQVRNLVLACRSLFWPSAGIVAWPQGTGELNGIWFVERPDSGARRLFTRASHEGIWTPLRPELGKLEKCGWRVECSPRTTALT